MSNIVINSFLGTGSPGSVDGVASVVQFGHPHGMCIDNTGGSLYTTNPLAQNIRKTNTSDGSTISLRKFLFSYVLIIDEYFSWNISVASLL